MNARLLGHSFSISSAWGSFFGAVPG
jgi:hypothetical protein